MGWIDDWTREEINQKVELPPRPDWISSQAASSPLTACLTPLIGDGCKLKEKLLLCVYYVLQALLREDTLLLGHTSSLGTANQTRAMRKRATT